MNIKGDLNYQKPCNREKKNQNKMLKGFSHYLQCPRPFVAILYDIYSGFLFLFWFLFSEFVS